MAVSSQSPQISALRNIIEQKFGKSLKVHNDFVLLSEDIFLNLKERISESTLERIWNYSTRSRDSFSLRSMEVLCAYCGFKNWEEFSDSLKNNGSDSGMFDEISISSGQLNIGDRIRIGWLPDRVCIIKYLGDNRYMAEECENSTMKPGDTFSSLQFMLHQPAALNNFSTGGTEKLTSKTYVIGKNEGITILQILI